VNPEQAARVLAAFEKADTYDSLTWRVTTTPGNTYVKLFATCSDFFHYATADAEEIAGGDIPVLEACLADLEKTDEQFYLAELFAARKRKLRPLPLACQQMAEGTRLLFDAAGTEEERAEADRRDVAFWAHVGQTAEDAATREAG
jgi:hypothetical protein